MKQVSQEEKTLKRVVENAKLFDKKINSDYLKKVFSKESNKLKSKNSFHAEAGLNTQKHSNLANFNSLSQLKTLNLGLSASVKNATLKHSNISSKSKERKFGLEESQSNLRTICNTEQNYKPSTVKHVPTVRFYNF